MKLISVIIVSCFLVSCATGGSKKKSSTSSAKKSKKERVEETEESVGPGDTFITSLSNNSLTSAAINSSKAMQVAANISRRAKSKSELIQAIAAERLSRGGSGEILGLARKLADLELKGGINKQVPDEAKLEVGLSAVQSGNVGLAELMLYPLTRSRNGKVKAAAFNALGVLAIVEDRTTDAMNLWEKAGRAQSGYAPAMMNLGFTALKYADFDAANKAFGRIPEDWFVKYGKQVSERLTGNIGGSKELCQELLKAKPKHRAIVFNCGYLELKNGNKAKGKKLVTSAVKMRGGPEKWTDLGYNLLENLR